jgi:phosphohistidine phosphatase
MRRRLLVLRHGKSQRGVGRSDFGRSLVERGRLDVQRMAAWMQAQGLVPEHVVSSTAVRAKETVDAACKTMGIAIDEVRFDPRAYAATPSVLLAVVADSPREARSVLLVGHNPGLERLVVFLAGTALGAPPRERKLLPTAALAVLETDRDWAALSAGCSALISLTRPAEVPARFPAPDGRRGGPVERPAYYYTQSAVIPYRFRNGRLEVLIIASRKGKHWIVPKGIKEPELSARESAAKEALEEAGVRGSVGDEPLGAYDYQKWGGICRVDVYPMKVNRLVANSLWKERHRQRRWVSATEAQLLLKQPELRDMVAKLMRTLAG